MRKRRITIAAIVLVVTAIGLWFRFRYLPQLRPSSESLVLAKSLIGKDGSLKFFGFEGSTYRVKAVKYESSASTIFVEVKSNSGSMSMWIGLRCEADVNHFCSLFGVKSAGWSGPLSELYSRGL